MLTVLAKGVQTKYLNFSDWRFFLFATSVFTPVVHLELPIYLLIFEKIRNNPNGIPVLRGIGETDSLKKAMLKLPIR